MNRAYESRGSARERGRWDATEREYQSFEREPGYPRSGEFDSEPYGEHGRGGRYSTSDRREADYDRFDRFDRGRRGEHDSDASYYAQDRERSGSSGQGWYGWRPEGQSSSFERDRSGGWNDRPESNRSYNQGHGQGPGGYDFATPGTGRSDWRSSERGFSNSGYSGGEGYSGGYGTGGGGYGRSGIGASGYEGGLYGSGGYGGGAYGTGGYASGRSGGGSSGRSDEGYGRSSGRYGNQTAYPSAGEHTGRGPKSYRRSDERIREDINDRLTDDSDIDASEVTVNVSNGEVTLSGTVSDRRMKHFAESVAESVHGVKDVTNQIRVQRESDTESRGSESTQSNTQRSKSSMATART